MKYINTFLFNKIRLPKLSKKVWITPKELPKYASKVIWITRSSDHEDAMKMLVNRIRTLIKRSGFQFTFFYLKEVLRLVIRSLAGNPEPKFLKGVMVKRDHNGLPTIIPSSLRKALLDFSNNQRLVVCILSILSVFRVFPTKVRPSLGTIIEPFNGIIRTIDSSLIKRALAELTPGTLHLRSPTLLKLESAGPNAKKSAWGASIDAVAFLDNPKVLYNYIRYLCYSKCYWPIVWVLFIILVSSPIVIVLKTGKWLNKLNMGKLSVVYDQAGKARIVAITNWWIQVALKPLHNSIFSLLRRIEEDGTHDQLKPFKKLIGNGSSEMFYSFDLSAATDRLPLEIQTDILNILKPNLGTLWSNLLDFEWYWKGKRYVKYAVGQPMGAYSSWAMLALTHHVIVKVSALRVGLYNFKDYCILGDDVVIRNSIVAQEYYNLMNSLGVSINLSKSVNAKAFAEFAKRWEGPGVSITPIGPGLTLRLVRDRKYMATYLLEALKLNLFNNFTEVLATINSLRKTKESRSQVVDSLWSCFGLNSLLNESMRNTDVLSNIDRTIMFCFSSSVNYLPVLRYHICNALMQLQLDDIREAKRKLEVEEEFFYRNWWRTFSTNNWPLRLLETILKVVGPGFWIYATSFEESRASIEGHKLLNCDYSWDAIRDLVRNDPLINLSSIDWTQKQLIKDQSLKMKRFYKELERSQMEAPELFEQNVFY